MGYGTLLDIGKWTSGSDIMGDEMKKKYMFTETFKVYYKGKEIDEIEVKAENRTNAIGEVCQRVEDNTEVKFDSGYAELAKNKIRYLNRRIK